MRWYRWVGLGLIALGLGGFFLVAALPKEPMPSVLSLIRVIPIWVFGLGFFFAAWDGYEYWRDRRAAKRETPPRTHP